MNHKKRKEPMGWGREGARRGHAGSNHRTQSRFGANRSEMPGIYLLTTYYVQVRDARDML